MNPVADWEKKTAWKNHNFGGPQYTNGLMYIYCEHKLAFKFLNILIN